MLKGSCRRGPPPVACSFSERNTFSHGLGQNEKFASSGLCRLPPAAADIGERKTGAQLRLRRGPFAGQAEADEDAESNAELLISALCARELRRR
jgi:hypothetical protein